MALDPKQLERTREARAAALDLQYEAERAQLRFQHEIRKLHAAGASLREIAESLGLSHQRVHQIVDPESGKAALKPKYTVPEGRLLHCSFCSRSQAEVSKLIAGPSVAICDTCTHRATSLIATGRPARGQVKLRLVSDETCDFCGQGMQPAGKRVRRRGVTHLVRGAGTTICNECIGLCNEILAEESTG